MIVTKSNCAPESCDFGRSPTSLLTPAHVLETMEVSLVRPQWAPSWRLFFTSANFTFALWIPHRINLEILANLDMRADYSRFIWILAGAGDIFSL